MFFVFVVLFLDPEVLIWFLLHFLQVLKGHIALGVARFPNGTNGIFDVFILFFVFIFFTCKISQIHNLFNMKGHRHLICFHAGHALDILARVPLWKNGLDYRHGTGHGIGSYLNVHEG